MVDCCHLETQALAGTLVYNISKPLAGRLGAWMESEMSGVVSSLGGLDAEQQCKYIHCLVLVSLALVGQVVCCVKGDEAKQDRSQTKKSKWKQ